MKNLFETLVDYVGRKLEDIFSSDAPNCNNCSNYVPKENLDESRTSSEQQNIQRNDAYEAPKEDCKKDLPKPTPETNKIGELEIVNHKNKFKIVKKGVKTIGILINNRFILEIKENRSLANQSINKVKEYINKLPKINGKSWSLLTDDKCNDLVKIMGNSRNNGLNSLLVDLGGDPIENAEYLTPSLEKSKKVYRVRLCLEI